MKNYNIFVDTFSIQINQELNSSFICGCNQNKHY